MQCKDLPNRQVLEFLRDMPDGFTGAGWHDLSPRADYMPTVRDAMPSGTPDKLIRAKMGMLIRRGMVDGCTCGCRGDFELTPKGLAQLTKGASDGP